MAFGLNRAELIGRIGADVTVNHLVSGGRVANFSVATDESYIDRNSGERQDRTEWHRIVTFQPGLVDMLAKNAKKGRLVYVAGKLQTRRWKRDGEDSDRFSTDRPGALGRAPSAAANHSWDRPSLGVRDPRRNRARPVAPAGGARGRGYHWLRELRQMRFEEAHGGWSC